MKLEKQYQLVRNAYAKALQHHRPSRIIGKRLQRIVANILRDQQRNPQLPLVTK